MEDKNKSHKPAELTPIDKDGQDVGGVSGGANLPSKERAAKRRRRVRSPHPGVKVLRRKRKSGDVWLARWNDAITGRQSEQSLTYLGLTTAEARKGWATKKAQELNDVKKLVSLGFANTTEKPIADALRDYIESVGARCKSSTLQNYRESIDAFAQWLKLAGVKRTAELNFNVLIQFYDHWTQQRAKMPVQGKRAGRGKKQITSKPRSAHSVNKGLRSIRTMLSWWRKHGYTPLLNSDVISDALPHAKTKRCMPNFLSVDRIRSLLDACKRHDAQKYKITRAEHDSGSKGNATPRYFPATEFVLVMLLTGMRLTETITLKWEAVDFASEQITLSEDDTKTGHARHVDLRVCPSLLKLLARMKLSCGSATFVFGHHNPTSKSLWDSTKKRLITAYGAPQFTWHDLRRTCETFLVCAPGIYGAASTLLAARRTGHSVQVAERHYLGLIRSIPHKYATLELAMEIGDIVETSEASDSSDGQCADGQPA